MGVALTRGQLIGPGPKEGQGHDYSLSLSFSLSPRAARPRYRGGKYPLSTFAEERRGTWLNPVAPR